MIRVLISPAEWQPLDNLITMSWHELSLLVSVGGGVCRQVRRDPAEWRRVVAAGLYREIGRQTRSWPGARTTSRPTESTLHNTLCQVSPPERPRLAESTGLRRL